MSPSNFCFIFLLFSTLHSLCNSERCNPEDKKVLLEIKKALNDPYVLASWKNDTDCCGWYTVSCDSTNRINSLTIFSTKLSGQIPPQVGDLPYLTMLDLNSLSNVTGPIPTTIANLTKLTFLRLKYLNLSGPIPSSLSQLKNVTYFDLAYNDLTGTIPSSLSSLQKLDALHLDNNKLSGSIPESFGHFTGSVPSLYLSNNNLSGGIPASLGNMDWYKIDLSGNSLVGDASMLFGLNKSTIDIDISSNMFNFNLSNVVFPSGLTNLNLAHNEIYGSIPDQATQLNLQKFNVSYNQLCGQIPVGGKLQSFGSSAYAYNKCLCGAPLPSCS